MKGSGLLVLLVLFLLSKQGQAAPASDKPPAGTQGLASFDDDPSASFPVRRVSDGWALDEVERAPRLTARFGIGSAATVALRRGNAVFRVLFDGLSFKDLKDRA